MGEGDVEPGFIPLEHPDLEGDEMLRRAKSFYSQMKSRRTTRLLEQGSSSRVDRVSNQDCQHRSLWGSPPALDFRGDLKK